MQLKVTLLLWLGTLAASAATIQFSWEPIGPLGFTPTGMNNDGWIVGHTNHAFRYRPGVGLEALSTQFSRLHDINNAGTAVGSRGNITANASVRPAGQAWDAIGPGTAFAINESGAIVGEALSDFARTAFLYTEADGMKILHEDRAEALDINEAGQVVGQFGFTSSPEQLRRQTFLYDPDEGTIDLSALIGDRTFRGSEISDDGVVAGIAYNRYWRLALYSPTLGYQTIGRLGSGNTTVTDGNGNGWVVGTSSDRAFLYLPGTGLMNLNSLVPDAPVKLVSAVAVNDLGKILARGSNGRYYLLSPTMDSASLVATATPEPSGYFLMGAGIAVLAVLARRNRLNQRIGG